MAKFSFCFGVIVGATVVTLALMPRLMPSRRWVEDARRQFAHLESLPEVQQRRFWEQTQASQGLREAWAVRAALAEIRFADEAD